MRIIQEVQGEGFEKFLGQDVCVFAANYIYHGKLTGVNNICLRLEGAKIVYETDSFDKPAYKDAQAVIGGNEWYVMLSAIESFGPGKKG